MLLLALTLVTAAGCAEPPQIQLAGAQGRITKGPCLLRVYQDRAALMWETDTQGQWGVSCGTRGQHDRYVVSAAEKVMYSSKAGDGGPKSAYIHKVWIDGLIPGRTYAYRLVGPDVRSDVYRFRTVAPETAEVRFIVYGDSRTQPDIHRQLVKQMIKCNADFVVHTGDLAARGDDYSQWGPQFFEPLKGLIEQVPIYIAKGNHEGRNGNFEKLLIPPGEENHFGFSCGPLHYFCVDNVSSVLDTSHLVDRIVRDAETSKALWEFVSYHVPSVNLGGHASDWRQSDVLSAFAKVGIDLVITGHSHQYERFRPVKPPEQTGSYVTYITAGGGGAPLYPVEPTALHAFAKSVYHFCLFHIKGDTLTMDAIDPEGRVIDHLKITKKDGRLDEPYLSMAIPAAAIQFHQSLYKDMEVILPGPLEAGEPRTISFRATVPPFPRGARLTFELRGASETYRLPQPQTVEVSGGGGRTAVKLTVTPNVVIDAKDGSGKAVPMEPALSLHCRYEFAGVSATVSRPVTIIRKRPSGQ